MLHVGALSEREFDEDDRELQVAADRAALRSITPASTPRERDARERAERSAACLRCRG